MSAKKSDQTLCPCGSNKLFSQCCAPTINTTAPAQTAEALMRSRYCAYVLNNEAYLLNSWHSSTRPAALGLAEHEHGTAQWIGLKIISTSAGGPDDAEGMVEFVARYKINGKAHRMQEKSRFVKEAGCWLYVDGEVSE